MRLIFHFSIYFTSFGFKGEEKCVQGFYGENWSKGATWNT